MMNTLAVDYRLVAMGADAIEADMERQFKAGNCTVIGSLRIGLTGDWWRDIHVQTEVIKRAQENGLRVEFMRTEGPFPYPCYVVVTNVK